ncbi:MAG: tyrosine-protein phosphatase [Polyangiaceae bacterium]|nr:tyrosine-protein phosphatase [Polyangiaceae bacterium]
MPHSRRDPPSNRWAFFAVLGLLGPGCGSSTAGPRAPFDAASPGRNAAGASGVSEAEGSDSTILGGPVSLDGVVNARQTGGLVTADGHRVRQNALIRSGQLSALTADGCDAFRALGIRTVIDMRSASEVSSDPDVQCVHTAASYYDADVPKILPPSEQSYLQTLDALEPVLAEVFTRLAASDALPAIVHCVIGRDRASLMTALVLMAIGVPVDTVVADMVSNQETEVQAAWMDGVVARVDQAGGIGAYLAGHGVSAQLTEALRKTALE